MTARAKRSSGAKVRGAIRVVVTQLRHSCNLAEIAACGVDPGYGAEHLTSGLDAIQEQLAALRLEARRFGMTPTTARPSRGSLRGCQPSDAGRAGQRGPA